jgi:AraC-like DNA-binding protein
MPLQIASFIQPEGLYQIEYLLISEPSPTDISNTLGFSEPRLFTRAFKYWTGVSPSRYVPSEY